MQMALKEGHSLREIGRVFMLITLTSVLGAKWGHVLFEAAGHTLEDGQVIMGPWDLIKADPWHALRLNDPGYVFYGGLIGASVVAFYYPTWVNYVPKALSLGLLIGRLGCFWVGCCHGIASLPIQLFEAGFAGWLLWKVDRIENWLRYYACWRFGIEFLRADESRGIWSLGLSTSQWVSLVILGILAGSALTKSMRSSQLQA